MRTALLALSGWLAIAICGAGCAAPAMGRAAPPICGPFGDPPAIFIAAIKPYCPQGELLGPWKDSNGAARFACLWVPPQGASKKPLPMVIYLHPSLFTSKTAVKTGLLLSQGSVSLSANPGDAGYIVLAPAGRMTLHHYPRPDEKGLGWDNWYRQLNPAGDQTVGNSVYRENVDAATIDHFVAQEVESGAVDPARIYVTGWSNGAAMAILYALNRPNIAAAPVYSAPNPFGAFNDPCPQTPVKGPAANDKQIQIFNPRVPLLHVHNSCDIAGICPNGERMAKQLGAAGVSVRDTIIDLGEKQVKQCSLACGADEDASVTPASDPLGFSMGLIEHGRWPNKWTVVMLDFMRAHALEANP